MHKLQQKLAGLAPQNRLNWNQPRKELELAGSYTAKVT